MCIRDRLMDESDLYFHTSWDWLMPVIHKCENLRLSSPGSEVYYDILMHEIHNRLMQANILDTFEEVVRFIQWHNQNKAE